MNGVPVGRPGSKGQREPYLLRILALGVGAAGRQDDCCRDANRVPPPHGPSPATTAAPGNQRPSTSARRVMTAKSANTMAIQNAKMWLYRRSMVKPYAVS